ARHLDVSVVDWSSRLAFVRKTRSRPGSSYVQTTADRRAGSGPKPDSARNAGPGSLHFPYEPFFRSSMPDNARPTASSMPVAADEPHWCDVTQTLPADRRGAIISALRDVLPPECVLARDEELRPYECDGLSAFRQAPMAVAMPRTENE